MRPFNSPVCACLYLFILNIGLSLDAWCAVDSFNDDLNKSAVSCGYLHASNFMCHSAALPMKKCSIYYTQPVKTGGDLSI
jgi:hypothetical protein